MQALWQKDVLRRCAFSAVKANRGTLVPRDGHGNECSDRLPCKIHGGLNKNQ